MHPVHPHQILNDDQFHQLVDHGYVILPEFIRGEELATLQAAQRRVLKPWDAVKDSPPEGRASFSKYPYTDPIMAGLFRHPELLKIGRRYLKSHDVVFNPGFMFARYPGFVTQDTGHIDNGNNSLLPKSFSAREYSQLTYWIHLEEVKVDQAPLMLCSHKDDPTDPSKYFPLACPAGTVLIFTNYTWHKASSFAGSEGQRFTWGFMLGRRDHYFESLLHYTDLGQHPVFNQMVRTLTAQERCLFRFPPPSDPYYTKQTLEALEKQYPGWNARGEYQAMD